MLRSLTLVYLMYDEEENIRTALDEGIAYLEGDIPDWEIVVVDDGSKDRCAEIVEREYATRPEIQLVRHPQNRGMGAGMASGVQNATKEHFCFMPSDAQIPAVELRKLAALLQEADIALSVYGNRPNNRLRTLMSRSFRLYLRAMAGVRFQLEGLYLFPTQLARELLPQIQGDTFFFSFQLVQLAVERGMTTATTVIASRNREAGRSKVANPRRIKKVSDEVLAYRRRRRIQE